MNGLQLLNELNKLSPEDLELEVITEGCDCDGDVNTVTVSHGRIYLERAGYEVRPVAWWNTLGDMAYRKWFDEKFLPFKDLLPE